MADRVASIAELDFAPRGPVFPSPPDWRNHFLYQLMLDRFDDNREHPPFDAKTSPRGRDVQQGARFQGGNLKGVIRRLDYLKGMGVTGVWITPPFKQRQDDPGSYHGYGIQDFLAIDPRFGTTEDLAELTRQAHARGIYVILDIVLNHSADVFRYKGDGPHPFRAEGRYEFGGWHRVGRPTGSEQQKESAPQSSEQIENTYREIENEIASALAAHFNTPNINEFKVSVNRSTREPSALRNGQPVPSHVLGRIAAQVIKNKLKGFTEIDESALGPDDGIWPIELQDPDCFKRKGSIGDMAKAGREEMVSGDFFSFKDFDLANPKTMNALIHAYKYWIAVADVDGYRIDTVKNMEPAYVGIFCNAIREYCRRIGKNNFLIFGEIVGEDDLLQKYVGSNVLPPEVEDVEGFNRYPLLNAVLDFPLYAHLDEVLKGLTPPVKIWERFDHLSKYYRDFSEAGRYFVTFVDNHDQTHRPWRRFLHSDGDCRLAMLAAGFLLTSLGIPCLYYGTEQCLDGGGDRDVYIRECMFGGKWGAFDTTGVHVFNPEHPVYQFIKTMTRLRVSQPALRSGRQYFREISGNGKDFGKPLTGQATLAFSRVLDTDEVLVAINVDRQRREDWILVDPVLSSAGGQMIDLLNGGAPHPIESRGNMSAVRVPLEGRAMAVLKAK